MKFLICNCCDNSVFELVERLGGVLIYTTILGRHYTINQLSSTAISEVYNDLNALNINDLNIQGMIEILSYPIEDLENSFSLSRKSEISEDLKEAGKQLIEQCVDFLLFQKHIEYDTNGKYISIWSFIYDYLKFPQNSGYDYYLMCYLENWYIMEHGSGIRCGWFNGDIQNPYINRKLEDSMKQKILLWINT